MNSGFSSKEKRDIFLGKYYKDKDKIDEYIESGIEKNRKENFIIQIKDKDGNPIRNQNVKIRQISHDFKYGANIFLLDEFENETDNLKYRSLFKDYFNLATLPFYWDTLEPDMGCPRYDKNSKKIYRRPSPDLCIEYCKENNIAPKLHCLVYDKFVPSWLVNKPLEEVKFFYEKRFKEIAERYGKDLFEVEVTNEILQECWWRYKTALSEEKDIAEWSFNLARKYFKNNTLVINEGEQLTDIARKDYRQPYCLYLDLLLKENTPIDVIGIQHHYFVGAGSKNDKDYDNDILRYSNENDPLGYIKALDILSSFGKPISITEVTVPTFGDTQEDEILQADTLELWFSIWFASKNVESVIYWNTADYHAYVNGNDWNESNVRGGLFHKDLTPKESANRLYELFSRKWRTELDSKTDENGYVEFRGFKGEYSFEVIEK